MGKDITDHYINLWRFNYWILHSLYFPFISTIREDAVQFSVAVREGDVAESSTFCFKFVMFLHCNAKLIMMYVCLFFGVRICMQIFLSKSEGTCDRKIWQTPTSPEELGACKLKLFWKKSSSWYSAVPACQMMNSLSFSVDKPQNREGRIPCMRFIA